VELVKKIQLAIFFLRIAIAPEKVFARFFGPFFACCSLSKKRQPAIFFWESLSRRRMCLRDFSVLFLRVVVYLKNVFSDGQDAKYDRDPPSTSFSLYKQSRSDTGSTQKIGINKERESERFNHQRCRTYQWNCWLWAVYMFPESKIILPDENLRSCNLD